MADLYSNIKKLCDLKGINTSKMCSDIGISKSMISDLKNGRKKSLSYITLKKIADYFGVPVDYFFEDEIKEKANSPTGREDIKRKIDRLSDENFERLNQLLKLSMPEIFEDK